MLDLARTIPANTSESGRQLEGLPRWFHYCSVERYQHLGSVRVIGDGGNLVVVSGRRAEVPLTTYLHPQPHPVVASMRLIEGDLTVADGQRAAGQRGHARAERGEERIVGGAGEVALVAALQQH